MSRTTTNPAKWPVREAKTQISLGIRWVFAGRTGQFAGFVMLLAAHYYHESSDSVSLTARALRFMYLKHNVCCFCNWPRSLTSYPVSLCSVLTLSYYELRIDTMSTMIYSYFAFALPGGGGWRGRGCYSLYFAWYRCATGIAPIFQVIYISIGHHGFLLYYTSIALHSVPSCATSHHLTFTSPGYLVVFW